MDKTGRHYSFSAAGKTALGRNLELFQVAIIQRFKRTGTPAREFKKHKSTSAQLTQS